MRHGLPSLASRFGKTSLYSPESFSRSVYEPATNSTEPGTCDTGNQWNPSVCASTVVAPPCDASHEVG